MGLGGLVLIDVLSFFLLACVSQVLVSYRCGKCSVPLFLLKAAGYLYRLVTLFAARPSIVFQFATFALLV
jgi:hypothetical protein